jgi:2-methylcitrate dehydratase PrpD
MQAHLEGSIALPLQIANAARAAVSATDLVAEGLTAPHDVLEGRFGFYSLFEEGELARYTTGIGQRWLIEDVSTKPFPSGRASHAALGALQDLKCAGAGGADIAEVVLMAPPLVRRLVDRPAHAGMSAAYARLCLPFLAALMLKEGRIDPRSFTPQTFGDAELLALASRVRIEPDENQDPNALRPQSISVTRSGRQPNRAEMFNTLGDPAAPMDPHQSAAKYNLVREIAGNIPDPRIFDDPLAYFTEPR